MQLKSFQIQTTEKFYKSGRVKNKILNLGFWTPESPLEISFTDYQDAVKAIEKMPLFCKVILRFKEKSEIQALQHTDNFVFNKCTKDEKMQVFASLKNILLPLFKKRVAPNTATDAQGVPLPTLERFEKAEDKDLAFLNNPTLLDLPNSYLIDLLAEMVDLLRDIFYKISDSFIFSKTKDLSQEEANEVLQGAQVFNLVYTDPKTKLVVKRLFYLPIEKLKNYYHQITIAALGKFALSNKGDKGQEKTEAEQRINYMHKKIKIDQFPEYTAWNATTALHFGDLQDKGQVPPAIAICAKLAALCVEIETLEPFCEKLKPQKSTADLGKETQELISLFSEKLTMFEAHQVNFFLRYTERQFATRTL